MARFHVSWRINTATWPKESKVNRELNETFWTVIDDLIKKGLVKDYGIFPDGDSGYLIGEGETTNIYSAVNMFIPYVSCEVHEIISFEKQKEIQRALMAAVDAMRK